MKRIGVLLVNLGTPEAPTKKALRKYLAEFLSDPRVIEVARIPWKIILHGVILNTRPKYSAKKYQTIWTEEGSPLLVITQKQKNKLKALLPDSYDVEIAMRYGNPSIEEGLKKLLKNNMLDQIIIFPLYPQYCAATTATVFDKVAEVLKRERFFPELAFLSHYYKNEKYILACAEHITEELSEKEVDQIIFSYHGMPLESYKKGDPYYDHCMETSLKIANQMGLEKHKYQTVFQSRFGKSEWLQPYAIEYLSSLPNKGVNKIAIFCPGFSADCLETLEEMGVENRNLFLEMGGKEYYFIPCLNDKVAHIEVLRSCLLD